MHKAVVPLGPIHLVLSLEVEQKQLVKRNRYPFIPNRQELWQQLLALGSQSGVPARVRQEKGQHVLFIYTNLYYLKAYPTERQGGYNIGYIDPLGFREHQDLTKGALFLQATNWQITTHQTEIPQGITNCWPNIMHAWDWLQQQRPQNNEIEEMAPAHENYLTDLEEVIDLALQLEQTRNRLPEPIHYKSLESADNRRISNFDTYIFQMVGQPQVSEKQMLQLEERPDLRGRVLALTGSRLTVKFERTIDLDQIPAQGSFTPTPNLTIFKAQNEAIKVLREQEASNPNLLRILVDQHYQQYQKSSKQPQSKLNEAQLQAFQRSTTVPDLLLVLGPPGTGKTTTITEMVRSSIQDRKRVLITSATHKAVDNVLERLSQEELSIIRFGREEKLSEHVQKFLIDVQAQQLAQQVLQRTSDYYHNITQLHDRQAAIDRMYGLARTHLNVLVSQEQAMRQQQQQQFQIEQQLLVPFKPQMQSLEERHQSLTNQHHQAAEAEKKWIERIQKAAAKNQYFMIGVLFHWLEILYTKRLEETRQNLNEISQMQQDLANEVKQLQQIQQQTFEKDGHYQQIKNTIERQYQEYNSQQRLLGSDLEWLRDSVHGFLRNQPPTTPPSVEVGQQYLDWLSQIRTVLTQRQNLLKNWRDTLSSKTQDLQAEMLHYADVVGATCIGVSTARGLKDIDFDLVIVDEAGQIGIQDLLVPLVRAKRAVLVGDHQQLPPFVDSEVQERIRTLSPHIQKGQEDLEADNHRSRYLLDLISKSAFEQLFLTNPDPEHYIRLNIQHRMPAVISDFISDFFYDKQLYSADYKRNTNAHQDLWFRSPLSLIDTSDVSFEQRREWKRQASENWQIAGYTNLLETQIVTRIVEGYDQQRQDWVVIVPYRAQAQQIIGQIERTLKITIEGRVATVDSFQGGERDQVIYSFTRSNENGEIGFLRELRRLNVAMSRARKQLVLVGDFSTLRQARDPEFRRIMQTLYSYTRQHGEILTTAQWRQRQA